jgi:thiamine biosynthesis protein ThiI
VDPDPALPYTFLVRLSGEVSTKARYTRGQFVQRLRHNLCDAFESEGIAARVRATRERIYVDAASPAAGDVAARVFGVSSVSPALRLAATDLAGLVAAGSEHFAPAVRGRRFAVRARRVGDRDRVATAPRELERELGTALLPESAGVDLTNPEVTAGFELHAGESYLFAEKRPGPAGLPLGVEGRAVTLVSGGFDSAVAAWQMARRGVSQHWVFCNLGGASHRLGVLRVMKLVADRWSYGTRPRLHSVDFEEAARELRERTEKRYWQVLLKRRMLRAAEAVAREVGAEAIVTGEAVGQVSSQTLTNLAAISPATRLPILRPLVGSNKDEIIAWARHIGTAPLSAVVDEYCAMVPSRPATAASLEVIEAQEAALDPALLERAVAGREVFDLRGLDVEAIAIPDLEVDAVPDEAVVIDLRARAAYDAWHWPDALHLDFDRALASYAAFDREATYVLVCEFGLKSAHLAERMRETGLRAWNFAGGFASLLRHAEAKGLTDRRLLGL